MVRVVVEMMALDQGNPCGDNNYETKGTKLQIILHFDGRHLTLKIFKM